MTALHLLALAGYFLILFEFIAMRHRVICAESDLDTRISLLYGNNTDWEVFYYYRNRGTK